MEATTRGRGPDTVLGLASLAILYGERGSAHTLGTTGWLAVVLASLVGLWVGWTGAGRNLYPSENPPRDNRAAVLLGLILLVVALRYFGKQAGSPVFIWSTGMFFVSSAVAVYARYAWARARR